MQIEGRRIMRVIFNQGGMIAVSSKQCLQINQGGRDNNEWEVPNQEFKPPSETKLTFSLFPGCVSRVLRSLRNKKKTRFCGCHTHRPRLSEKRGSGGAGAAWPRRLSWSAGHGTAWHSSYCDTLWYVTLCDMRHSVICDSVTPWQKCWAIFITLAENNRGRREIVKAAEWLKLLPDRDQCEIQRTVGHTECFLCDKSAVTAGEVFGGLWRLLQ